MYQSLLQICQRDTLFICALIIGTLFIIGIIGNSLTFAVFWKGKFKASTSFLFMCLALTDTTLLLTAFPVFSLVYVDLYMGSQLALGKFAFILGVVSAILQPLAETANIWLTVLIAVNRYIIVCVPLRASRWCTNRNVKIQLAVVLLFALLYYVAKVVIVFVSPIVLLYIHWHIFILDAMVMLILPTSILALLNIRLIIALRAHRRMQAQNQSSQNKDSTTFVLVIVVVVLIVCQLPRIAFPVLVLALPVKVFITSGLLCSLLPISNILVVFNSIVNFFIYILFKKPSEMF